MASKKFLSSELEEAGKLADRLTDYKWKLLFKFLFIICSILLDFKLDDEI